MAGMAALYKWVAILTGSKNALKGIGFFVGGRLLTAFGFQPSLRILAGLVHVGGNRSPVQSAARSLQFTVTADGRLPAATR